MEVVTVEREAHAKAADASVWSDADERLMRRALELAAMGRGQVSPGPLVGCVIADSGGAIYGEGYYRYEQVAHAEAIALAFAGTRAHGATAYVSLEPHAHHGRTPPCTDALIAAGIARVVAPIEDPNPLVSGLGFSRLREAGLEVHTGLLADEAATLNETYFHSYKHARPFVHLKLATSLDGRIATASGDARWITGEAARGRVHELRHEYDAILVGAGTTAADDPQLTDRSGQPRHRPLARVVLDERLTLSPQSLLARTSDLAPVIVFTCNENADQENRSALETAGVEVVPLAGGGRDLGEVLCVLHERNLRSLLVEGGAGVAGAFLDAGLIDKLSIFLAPIILGGRDSVSAVGGAGVARIADALRLTRIERREHGDDLEITGYPEKQVMSDK